MNSNVPLQTIRSKCGFTVLELVVAIGLTAFLAGFMVSILTNVSDFWLRSSGRASAEARARRVLDQLTLDLQGALYRDDGNTWLAATILSDTQNTHLWDNQETTAGASKPANADGSLQFVASGALSEAGPNGARFGVAGTWLRFFTIRHGDNTSSNNSSAPVAIAYQIVRRPTKADPSPYDRKYVLHRSEVRGAGNGVGLGTLQAGFSITAPAYESHSQSAVFGDPSTVRFPAVDETFADNVIDFGIRLYVRSSATAGGTGLRQIFPSTDSDLSHHADMPPRAPGSVGQHENSFPDVVDIMIRVLTEDGAKVLAGYEGNPQRILSPLDRTPEQYWWDLALAHSQVFTRRVALDLNPL